MQIRLLHWISGLSRRTGRKRQVILRTEESATLAVHKGRVNTLLTVGDKDGIAWVPSLREGTSFVSVNVVLVRNGVQQVTTANPELIFKRVAFDGAIGALSRRIEGGKLTLSKSFVPLIVLRDPRKHQLLSEWRFIFVSKHCSFWWALLTADMLSSLIRTVLLLTRVLE